MGSGRGGMPLPPHLRWIISVVQERAQRWNPAPRPPEESPQSPVVKGVGGAISAGVVDERNRVLGQGFLPGEEKVHAYPVH